MTEQIEVTQEMVDAFSQAYAARYAESDGMTEPAMEKALYAVFAIIDRDYEIIPRGTNSATAS